MTAPHHDVDPAAARLMIHQASAVLIDVREDDEWAAGHAPEAIHIRLGALDPADFSPEQTLVVVCRSGQRSAQAAAQLAAAGLRAHNLAGGMKAWANEGLATIRDDNSPGTVA